VGSVFRAILSRSGAGRGVGEPTERAAEMVVDGWVALVKKCGMTASTKKILQAVFWFVLGHLSCAVMHHLSWFAAR
jgi:hypothetical protein